MKRSFLILGLIIALLLGGCGSSAARVEFLKSWSFQENDGTNDYSLFFGLADKKSIRHIIDDHHKHGNHRRDCHRRHGFWYRGLLK